MKSCKKCNKKKEESEFGKDLQKVDGIYSYCKECIKKRSKKQREKNSEYTKKYAKEYRRKNTEVLKEKAVISYYLNLEKRSQQAKKSYEKHKKEIAKKRAEKRRSQEQKEKNRIRMAEWRKNNRTKMGEIVTKWKKENPKKANAHSLVLFATKTGILKRNEICEECGIFCKTEGHHEDYSKPLDVIWVCKMCHSKKHQIYR